MRNSHSSLQSAPFFRVLSSPDVPAKHQETAAGWGGKNSDGRALDNWYDFDSSRTPSKPQSKKERLARLLKNFECSEHNADCALLACLEREKADELSEIQSEQTQKSTLNKDYEVGALLLDLNRGRIFGDNVTATRIKKKVDEMPLVAILPLVKQLHDSISDLPESRHSKAVKNTFNMLTQGLAFIALDDSDAPQVMALIDKTYREADFRRNSITKTWRILDRRMPHEAFVRNTYRPGDSDVTSSPPEPQSSRRSTAATQPRHKKTTGRFTKKYPLTSVWLKQKAIYDKWQSKSFPDYLICPKFNNAGCPKREDRCDRVHECMSCDKMGHGQSICPRKA